MPYLNDKFGLYNLDGEFWPYRSTKAEANDFHGLETWRILPKSRLDLRPLQPGDLVFYHATKQYQSLDKQELEMKSESGEFLPGFYTTSGADLNDSIKLGWYWYECKRKVTAPNKNWFVIAFVLRKEHFEGFMAGPSVRDTCRYYLQEPRSFIHGGATHKEEDLKQINFANNTGQIMIFPDKKTKVQCKGAISYSLDDMVYDRKGLDALSDYTVIVGLQKPEPLDMRQQNWVSPKGLWHINQAERYVVFDRAKEYNLPVELNAFVQQNNT